MGWREKLQDPEHLRWYAFLLAALAGLVTILVGGGVIG